MKSGSKLKDFYENSENFQAVLCPICNPLHDKLMCRVANFAVTCLFLCKGSIACFVLQTTKWTRMSWATTCA